MQNGTYQARFFSGTNCVEGDVAVQANTLNGGAGGYICQGTVSRENETLSGKLTIKLWDYQANHALGLFKEIEMAVTGKYDTKKRCFHLEGQANGHHVIRIRISGQWVAPLSQDQPRRGGTAALKD